MTPLDSETSNYFPFSDPHNDVCVRYLGDGRYMFEGWADGTGAQATVEPEEAARFLEWFIRVGAIEWPP